MNLLLLFEDDLISRGAGGACRARVGGRRREHVLSVHRAGPGDELRAGLLGGAVGTAKVLALDSEWLDLELQLSEPPPPPVALSLLLALPRPKALRRVIQAVTAMGVKEVVLIGGYRVEKSYWQSPLLADASLHECMLLGLEQARDTVLPRIRKRRLLKPFVEDELGEMAAGTLALVAHPLAAEACPQGLRTAVTLAVGPEGGFTDYEISLLGAAGLRPVHIGERPLRVEHAVPALIGRLALGAA